MAFGNKKLIILSIFEFERAFFKLFFIYLTVLIKWIKTKFKTYLNGKKNHLKILSNLHPSWSYTSGMQNIIL